jgi:rubredoxin
MTLPARFEGSYLGDRARVPADARLECKICWWVYDPAAGDPQWQIAPGTPFRDLPARWTCPQCEGRAEQFMVIDGAH